MFFQGVSDINKNEVKHDEYEVGSRHASDDGVC